MFFNVLQLYEYMFCMSTNIRKDAPGNKPGAKHIIPYYHNLVWGYV